MLDSSWRYVFILSESSSSIGRRTGFIILCDEEQLRKLQVNKLLLENRRRSRVKYHTSLKLRDLSVSLNIKVHSIDPKNIPKSWNQQLIFHRLIDSAAGTNTYQTAARAGTLPPCRSPPASGERASGWRGGGRVGFGRRPGRSRRRSFRRPSGCGRRT